MRTVRAAAGQGRLIVVRSTRFVVGVVTGALALGAVAGCSGTGGGAAKPDAVALLSKSTEALKTQPVRMAMDLGKEGAMTVQLDSANHNAEINMSMLDKGVAKHVTMRFVGKKAFMKMPDPQDKSTDKTWMSVDPKAAGGGASGVEGGADAMGADQFITLIARAEQTGAHSFSGALDGTRTPQGKDAAFLKKVPLLNSLTEIPFTAETDDQGRLTKMAIQVKDEKVAITYSDYGTKVDIAEPPAAEVLDLASIMKSSGK